MARTEDVFCKTILSSLLSASEKLQHDETTEEVDSGWMKASWGRCPICHLETFMPCHELFAGFLHLHGLHSSFLLLGLQGRVTAN